MDCKIRVYRADCIDWMEELEYLDDDIKNLDSIGVKHRFMRALQMRDKSMSFKLLGRLRELDEGEDYYFEALAHYINDEYKDAIRYCNKVEHGNIDYNSAVAIKLECYSLMGELNGFLNCMQENSQLKMNYWHFEYLLMSLLLRIHPDKVEESLEEKFAFFKDVDFDENADAFYMGQLFRLVADIVVEGLDILEEHKVLSKLDEGAVLSEKKLLRFNVLSGALSLFPGEIHNLLDYDYIEDKEIKELKQEAELTILPLLIDNNPEQTFENIKKAFLCQLHLGDTEAFLNNVSNNFDVLVQYSKKGESGADELMRLAYIEGVVHGKLDEKIKDHVEQSNTKDLGVSIADQKIVNFLSEQGRQAYRAAEWQYQKTLEEDYGWRDAGMISLSFYRILEVELNKKFIVPLLSSLGYSLLDATYTSHFNTLNSAGKHQYKRKWGTILKTYQDMEAEGFTGNGFMLGVMDYFFRAIGSGYDPTDVLAVLIRNNLSQVLNPYGITMFGQDFFENITKDDIRNKYRNPPAHTRYLTYETACECREVFRETVLKMCEMVV